MCLYGSLSPPTSLNPCPLTPSSSLQNKTKQNKKKFTPHCSSLLSLQFASLRESSLTCFAIPSPVAAAAASLQSPVEVVSLSHNPVDFEQTNRELCLFVCLFVCLHRSGNPRPRVVVLKQATIAKARGSVRGGRARGSKASASRSSRKAAASAKRAARKMKRQERGWRPKRALGPYMFFCKDQHANVTADNPNIPFTEVGRILGAQWQQMTEKDKKPYTKKAEADKKRYLKDLKRCKNK